MTDRRRYTRPKTLQAIWTVLVAGVTVALVVVDVVSTVIAVGGAGVCWVAGLVAVGLSERRHWTTMVAASSFDPGPSGHTVDLQRIIRGQSVTVATDVDSLLAPEHIQIRAAVEGVDASFTVRIVDRELADRTGVTTGVDDLDERFVFTGAEGNISVLLTETVKDALLAVEAPGTFTVQADRVVFEVPFTRLTAEELDAAGDAVAALAAQLESATGK
jgi:hypothetical protein